MTCSEGNALEYLAVHATHVACDKNRTAALSLDADEGNEGKCRKDGNQSQKAQYDVRQAFEHSVEDVLQR